MTQAAVQSGGASVTNTGSIAATLAGVAAHNLLVSVVSILQASTTAQAAITPTDTSGTWVDAGSSALALDATNSVRHGVMIGYQKDCSAGSHTVTYTFPNGVTYAELTLIEVSLSDTTAPLDSTITGNTLSVTGGATSPRTVGPTSSLAQGNNFVVAGFEAFSPTGAANAGITHPPTGYTSLRQQQATNTTIGAEHAYKRVGVTTGVSATWAWTDGTVADVAAMLAVFKESAETLMAQCCV